MSTSSRQLSHLLIPSDPGLQSPATDRILDARTEAEIMIERARLPDSLLEIDAALVLVRAQVKELARVLKPHELFDATRECVSTLAVSLGLTGEAVALLWKQLQWEKYLKVPLVAAPTNRKQGRPKANLCDGDKIRSFRLKQAHTQPQFIRGCKISADTLQRAEDGHATTATLRKIARRMSLLSGHEISERDLKKVTA